MQINTDRPLAVVGKITAVCAADTGVENRTVRLCIFAVKAHGDAHLSPVANEIVVPTCLKSEFRQSS